MFIYVQNVPEKIVHTTILQPYTSQNHAVFSKMVSNKLFTYQMPGYRIRQLNILLCFAAGKRTT